MSANVKTRAGNNPLQKQEHTVPKTHGERRIRRKRSDAQTLKKTAPKKLDQFSSRGAKPGSLARFGNKASYVKNRRFTSSAVPHKRPMHEHVENGTAPRKEGIDAERPSDAKLLSFLKWIDNNEHAHNSNRFRAACKKHVQKSTTKA